MSPQGKRRPSRPRAARSHSALVGRRRPTNCAREGYLQDPVLDETLARKLNVPPTRRTDRGGGFMTAFSQFEVLSTTYPLGWDPGSREVWHGLRTAHSL